MKQPTARSVSFGSMLWIAGTLATGLATQAGASSIDYQINNNAGMIAPFQNQLVAIAGHLDYDPATQSILKFDVTLTTNLEFSGTYTDNGTDALIPSLGQPRIVFGGTANSGAFYAIDLFLNEFGGDGAYDIRFIDALGPPNYTLLPLDAQHRPTITVVTGSEAAVPEPSTWLFVLLGVVLVPLASSGGRRRFAR